MSETLNIDTAKFERGLTTRAQLSGVPDPLKPPDPSRSANSVFGLVVAGEKGWSQNSIDHSRRLGLSAALNTQTLLQQMRFIKALSPKEHRDLDQIIVCGSVFAPSSVGRLKVGTLCDEDYSIFVESIVLQRHTIAPTYESALNNAVVRHIQTVRKNLNLPVLTDFVSVAKFFGRLGQPGDILRLRDLERGAAKVKARWLHILGPDLLSLLQALPNPDISFDEEQYRVALTVGERWGARILIRNLFASRGASPKQRTSPKALAPLHVNRMRAQLPARRYFSRVASLLDRLSQGLSTGDDSATKDCVIALFVIDPTLVGFLDWPRISDTLRYSEAPADIRLALMTHIIISNEFIRRRFHEVYMNIGIGAFIADLAALSQHPRNDPISQLTRHIQSLPPIARPIMARSILQRPIIERLAGILRNRRGWPKDLSPSNETRSSFVRLNLLRNIRAAKLLPDQEIARMQDAEVALVREQHFHDHLREGRVRVHWPGLQEAVKIYLTSEFPIEKVLPRRLPGGQSKWASDPVVQYLAQQLVRILLITSEHNIDEVLSNNLRHGVVVPRFVRAFDDAFMASTRTKEPPREWNEASLTRFFSSNSAHILSLRDFVLANVDSFVDLWLNPEKSRSVVQSLEDALAHELAQLIGTQVFNATSLAEKSISRTRQWLARHLAEAVSSLSGEVRGVIEERIVQARSACSQAHYSQAEEFIESLQISLQDALEEVGRWLRSADKSNTPIPFSFSEVVRLELLTLWLATERSSVKVSARQRLASGQIVSADVQQIQGKYFDFFHAVAHNLVSNAFEHSGEGVHTDVEIDLLVMPSGFTVRCSNSMSSDRLKKVVEGWSSIVKSAHEEAPQRARRDKASGFQKIKQACQSAFRVKPVINIPPLSISKSRFIIEITVAKEESVLVEK